MPAIRKFIATAVIARCPLTRLFSLKRKLLRLCGYQIGDGVQYVSSARVMLSGHFRVGRDCWIGHEVLFAGGNADIVIGEQCDIAPRVLFVSGTHCIDTENLRTAGTGYSLPIIIGNGCWIGAGATILGGTVLGEKCIVAAGAVVKGDFPPRSVITGVPGRANRSI